MSRRRNRGRGRRNRLQHREYGAGLELPRVDLPTEVTRVPRDPEELTPAELAWVRLVLRQVKLPAIGTVCRDDIIVFANDPEYPSDGIAYIEPKMRERP